MSTDGRATAICPDAAPRKPQGQDGRGAVGTFGPRVTGMRNPVVLDADQRRGLLALVAAGKMERQSSRYFSAATGNAISTETGRFLKRHNFAVAGFSNEMVATERGKMIAKEMEEANATPAT